MSLVPYVIEQTSRGERSYDNLTQDLLKDRINFSGRWGKWCFSECDCCTAPVPGSRGSGKGYQFIHQQSGRFCDGRSGNLWYDAVHQVWCVYDLYWNGCKYGIFPSLRREKREASCASGRWDHDSSAIRWCTGQASEIQIAAEHILKTRRKLNEILAANTGQTLETISVIRIVTISCLLRKQKNTV